MKIIECIHKILTHGFRIELALASDTIFFLLINPKRITEPLGKLAFSIENEHFLNGLEADICRILNSQFEVFKQLSEPEKNDNID